jgi:hypothetical protein
MVNAKAPEQQETLEQVFENIGPKVSDVVEIIDGWTARIEFDLSRGERDKRFFHATQGVEKPYHAPHYNIIAGGETRRSSGE